MFARLPFGVAIVISFLLSGCPIQATAQEVTAPSTTPALADPPTKDQVVDAFPGTEDFEEASRIRVTDNSPESLGRVIELCESAIEKGLDEFDLPAAKQVLATTAFARAQLIVEQASGGRLPNNRMARITNEAMQDLKLAIENDPNFVDAMMLKARIHLVRQEIAKGQETLDQAEKVLETSLAADKSDTDAKGKLSEVLLMKSLSRQDADDRLKDLLRAIEISPDNERAIQLAVESMITLGRFEEAESILQKFMVNSPNNEYAERRWALLLVQSDKLEKALEFLTSRIAEHPDRSSLYSLRASVHLAMTKKEDEDLHLKASVADCTKALEIDADNLDAVLTRAKASLALKDFEQAKKDLAVVESARPELPDIVLLRMDIAIQEKRFADAISDMERLVQLNPENRMLLLQLAAFYQLDDRPKKALRIADRLLKSDETDWQALRLRGDILLNMGRHNEAIADYESAITNIPQEEDDYAGILNNLSWVMSTSPQEDVRNGQRALELGLKACELTHYSKPHILSTLAAAYAETSQFDKAVEWSEKAVELGRKESNEQIEQLEEELKNYRDGKPWREKKETEDKPNKPAPANSGIDT
ncbi:MAG: tetratricopeptide repeat protein [Planctomycetota bacterium]